MSCSINNQVKTLRENECKMKHDLLLTMIDEIHNEKRETVEIREKRWNMYGFFEESDDESECDEDEQEDEQIILSNRRTSRENVKQRDAMRVIVRDDKETQEIYQELREKDKYFMNFVEEISESRGALHEDKEYYVNNYGEYQEITVGADLGSPIINKVGILQVREMMDVDIEVLPEHVFDEWVSIMRYTLGMFRYGSVRIGGIFYCLEEGVLQDSPYVQFASPHVLTKFDVKQIMVLMFCPLSFEYVWEILGEKPEAESMVVYTVPFGGMGFQDSTVKKFINQSRKLESDIVIDIETNIFVCTSVSQEVSVYVDAGGEERYCRRTLKAGETNVISFRERKSICDVSQILFFRRQYYYNIKMNTVYPVEGRIKYVMKSISLREKNL
jgi:hypothetical protein